MLVLNSSTRPFVGSVVLQLLPLYFQVNEIGSHKHATLFKIMNFTRQLIDASNVTALTVESFKGSSHPMFRLSVHNEMLDFRTD